MLKRKTLACLLIPTLLLIPNASKANALSTEKVEDNKVINYNDTNDDLTLMNMYLNYELEWQRDDLMAKLHRDIKAKELITQKVNERIDSQIKRLEEQEQKRIEEENSYNIDFVLTYYSRHTSENGGFNCTAKGTPLREGIVANNFYPMGTKIILEDGREYIVEDRGGSSYFSNDYRLDVFVDTYDQNYVRSLGVAKIKGKVIYP